MELTRVSTPFGTYFGVNSTDPPLQESPKVLFLINLRSLHHFEHALRRVIPHCRMFHTGLVLFAEETIKVYGDPFRTSLSSDVVSRLLQLRVPEHGDVDWQVPFRFIRKNYPKKRNVAIVLLVDRRHDTDHPKLERELRRLVEERKMNYRLHYVAIDADVDYRLFEALKSKAYRASLHDSQHEDLVREITSRSKECVRIRDGAGNLYCLTLGDFSPIEPAEIFRRYHKVPIRERSVDSSELDSDASERLLEAMRPESKDWSKNCRERSKDCEIPDHLECFVSSDTAAEAYRQGDALCLGIDRDEGAVNAFVTYRNFERAGPLRWFRWRIDTVLPLYANDEQWNAVGRRYLNLAASRISADASSFPIWVLATLKDSPASEWRRSLLPLIERVVAAERTCY